MNKRQKVLFEQLYTYRDELLQLVEDVSDEAANMIPHGWNNNIRWNLGHIYLDQYLWIHTLTKEEVPVSMCFNGWFGFGTSPKQFTHETPTFQELIKLLNQQPDEIKGRYKDRLEEQFPPTEMGMHTIEQVLIRTIFHEGLHTGAILAIKKGLKMKTAEA
ncbi:DinB family protein [Bacillus gobiensis]|uniref:DinB family protein n=1 Tax=Bacillus gobiensis TaxID=1441095 RepID=UPI003D1B719C